LLFGVLAGICLLSYAFWGEAGSVLAMVMAVCAFLFELPFALPAVSYAIDEDRINRGRALAASTLGRLRVPESVGSLAYACTDSRLTVQWEARMALEQVLPLLTPEHYGQLPANTTLHLCSLLDDGDNKRTGWKQRPQLALMVLEALGNAGDGRAVPMVTQLIQRGVPDHIRTTALQVLPILEERRRQEEAAQILLRASNAEGMGADVLLRPTAAQSTTPPEQLLRSTNGEAPPE
jgi:HEAT repeat protein